MKGIFGTRLYFHIIYCLYFILLLGSEVACKTSLSYNTSYLDFQLLNHYIEPLKECLIQITNNKNLHIPYIEVPIISRYIDFEKQSQLPKLLKYPGPRQSIYQVLYYLPDSNRTLAVDRFENVFNVTANLTNIIGDNYYSDVFECPRSNLIHGGPDNQGTYGLCTKIKFYKYSGKTRPWKCEVFINMFPNYLYYSVNRIGSYWHWEYEHDNLAPTHVRNREFVPLAMSPLSIPRIHMIILPHQNKIRKSAIIRA